MEESIGAVEESIGAVEESSDAMVEPRDWIRSEERRVGKECEP